MKGAPPKKPSPRGEGGPKGRMRGQVSDLVRYPQGGFRRLRAASDFAHGGKVTKTPPGTAPDEHFVLIVAFPRTPFTGLPLGVGKTFPARKI